MGFSDFKCAKGNRRLCIASYNGHPALRLHFPVESPTGDMVAIIWSGVVTASAAKQWIDVLLSNDESISVLEIDCWRDEPTTAETYSRADVHRLGDDLHQWSERYAAGQTTLALSARSQNGDDEQYYLWGDFAADMGAHLPSGAEVGLRFPPRIVLSQAKRTILEKLLLDTFAFPIIQSEARSVLERIPGKLANLAESHAAQLGRLSEPRLLAAGE